MSIFSSIRNDIDNGTFRSDCRLPDHADLGAKGAAGWVPGAYEAVLMRSDRSIRRPVLLNYITARKVRRQMLRPSEKHASVEENTILKAGALAVIDPLISFLETMKTDKTAARTEALRLLKTADRRELVKAGIGLLGWCGQEEDIDDLLTVGAHEEFTFYVAPAISALAGREKVNGYLIPLARDLDGWGKTAILYELNYEDEKARDFVLKDGAKNRLGEAENANLCATKGRLFETLEQLLESENEPDRETFRGICDIMTGLTAYDGIHDSINDYKNGRAAREAFIALSGRYPYLAASDGRTGTIIEKLK